MKINSFRPPSRILMGPGPSNVHPRVLEAMARSTIGHLDPEFIRMMDELKTLLRETFLTKNEVTFPISGPGSLGMETAVVNMVEPGMKVAVCVNGAFGGRIREMVERHGGIPVVVDAPWGQPIDPAKLEDALSRNKDVKVVAFVHAETSTGAREGRAQIWLSDDRRHGHISRRHTGQGRRMGARRHLLREPEVSFVSAGTVADHLQRTRCQRREEPKGQSPKLVSRHQSRR